MILQQEQIRQYSLFLYHHRHHKSIGHELVGILASYTQSAHTTGVRMVDWVIPAVCEHVASQDALAGGDIGVGVDEPAHLWVIISALQVIEARFLGGRLATLTLCPTLGFHITKTWGVCTVAARE